MSKAYRTAMVVTLAATILGLVFAFAAPAIAMQSMPKPTLDSADLPGTLDDFIASTESMATVVWWLHLSGLARRARAC